MTERVDSLGMWDATMGFPEQVEGALTAADGLKGLPTHEEVENVVVLGMGSSGIAGEFVAHVAGQFMAVPVVVCKGYEPPNFVGPGTLCFAVSFSGNTEETIEAASLAYENGASLVTVTGGGQLGELAADWGSATVGVPPGIPTPRAGLGAMLVPVLTVLEDVGLYPGAREWVSQAARQLRRRRDQLARDESPARQMARRIGRTFPLVYGGGGLGTVAALRWKNQIVENAKAPSFYAAVPELMHNDICGWGQHGDVTRQVFTLVLLRHDHEHPQVQRRFDLIREWTEEAVVGIESVQAAGDGPLAQALDLVLFGDVVSLHLAFEAGVDPGPVPVVDQIKAALGS
jgi:glucose/mannose-6-phosphate isomerase